MCGILIVSRPTASESDFRSVLELCLAFALCRPVRRSCFRFEHRASVTFVNCLSVSIPYCFSFFIKKRSKLRNKDVNVSGSYLSGLFVPVRL